MSHYLSQNIRFLRKKTGLTQEELAQKLGINRAALGSYEEGRAEPRLAVLQHLCIHFGCSLDELTNQNLSSGTEDFSLRKKGNSLRILTVAVDKESEKEKVVVVPVKAAAGYMNGYGDIDFIESLPSFNLPLQELSQERSYRLFQVKGDSMLPIKEGSYIITEYLQDWTQVKDNHCYVVVTKDEGVVYKRLVNGPEANYTLKSDNPAYEPYAVSVADISEIWKATGYISLQLPEPGEGTMQADQIVNRLFQLQQDMELIKKKLNS